MNFGQTFICNICKKEPEGNYHTHKAEFADMSMIFYSCEGECNKKFRDKYINPFVDTPAPEDEPVNNRWEILDIR